jgi:hypothetical protein
VYLEIAYNLSDQIPVKGIAYAVGALVYLGPGLFICSRFKTKGIFKALIGIAYIGVALALLFPFMIELTCMVSIQNGDRPPLCP